MLRAAYQDRLTGDGKKSTTGNLQSEIIYAS